MERTFGKFLREKRLDKKFVLRKFAKDVGISPSFLSEIENEERSAPSDKVLKEIVRLLELSPNETEMFYDLAANAKVGNHLPADIVESVLENKTIKVALRVAKDFNATDEEWEDFMRRLKNRQNEGG